MPDDSVYTRPPSMSWKHPSWPERTSKQSLKTPPTDETNSRPKILTINVPSASVRKNSEAFDASEKRLVSLNASLAFRLRKYKPLSLKDRHIPPKPPTASKTSITSTLANRNSTKLSSASTLAAQTPNGRGVPKSAKIDQDDISGMSLRLPVLDAKKKKRTSILGIMDETKTVIRPLSADQAPLENRRQTLRSQTLFPYVPRIIESPEISESKYTDDENMGAIATGDTSTTGNDTPKYEEVEVGVYRDNSEYVSKFTRSHAYAELDIMPLRPDVMERRKRVQMLYDHNESSHKEAIKIAKNIVVFTRNLQLQREEMMRRKRDPIRKYDDLRDVLKWGPPGRTRIDPTHPKFEAKSKVAMKSLLEKIGATQQDINALLPKTFGDSSIAVARKITTPIVTSTRIKQIKNSVIEVASLSELPDGVHISYHPRWSQVCRDHITRGMALPFADTQWHNTLRQSLLTRASGDKQNVIFAATCLGFIVNNQKLAPVELPWLSPLELFQIASHRQLISRALQDMTLVENEQNGFDDEVQENAIENNASVTEITDFESTFQ